MEGSSGPSNWMVPSMFILPTKSASSPVVILVDGTTIAVVAQATTSNYLSEDVFLLPRPSLHLPKHKI